MKKKPKAKERIIATAVRVEYLMEAYDLTYDQALGMIREENARRDDRKLKE